MFGSNCGFAASPESHSAAWSLEDHVEVHAEDAREGVILDTQIDVLLDAESEVSYILQSIPVSEKFFFFSSRSFTLSPRSKISSALSPRTVT